MKTEFDSDPDWGSAEAIASGVKCLGSRKDELLTAEQQAQLETCESGIAKAVSISWEIGKYLLFIHDNRLFGKSFRKYCVRKWGYSQERAYQHIAAFRILTVLTNGKCSVLPNSERQMRPLVKLQKFVTNDLKALTPEERQAKILEREAEADLRVVSAYQKACLTAAEGKPPSGYHIEQVIQSMYPEWVPQKKVRGLAKQAVSVANNPPGGADSMSADLGVTPSEELVDKANRIVQMAIEGLEDNERIAILGYLSARAEAFQAELCGWADFAKASPV